MARGVERLVMSRRTRLGFLLAGLVLLAILLLRVDLRGVAAALRAAHPRFLLLALGLLAANLLTKVIRWRLMVARFSGHRLGWRPATGAVFAGVAAASVSPGRTVDLAKPMLLKRAFGVELAASTAAVLVERLLDGAALVVLFGISLLALPLARGSQFHPVLLAAGLLIAAGALSLAAPRVVGRVVRTAIERLPLPDWLRSRGARMADALTDSLALWREGRNLWPLLGLSVLAALCEGGRLAAVFAAMGPQPGLPGAMLTFSVANLVAILVFIPGGIGVAELSMAGVAGAVLGMPATSPAVTAAVLLDRVLSYYLIVGIGALVLVAAGRPAGIRRHLA